MLLHHKQYLSISWFTRAVIVCKDIVQSILPISLVWRQLSKFLRYFGVMDPSYIDRQSSINWPICLQFIQETRANIEDIYTSDLDKLLTLYRIKGVVVNILNPADGIYRSLPIITYENISDASQMKYMGCDIIHGKNFEIKLFYELYDPALGRRLNSHINADNYQFLAKKILMLCEKNCYMPNAA